MNVGEIIIKAKMAIKEFEKDAKDVIEKAKEAGKNAGEGFANAFNKAKDIGKGLLGVVGNIAKGFAKILVSSGMLTTILGGAGLGALSLANALKKVFTENEQLKANIQYLVFAITKALEPATNSVANIIEKIINLLFQAIQYTAYLIRAWTGKNIFAGATMDAFAENMASANKDSKGVANNLKDAKKQLAGFDEMNVLNDTSGSGGGGASGGGLGAMPNFDLSKLDVNPPKWLTWLAKNGEKIRPILLGIVGGLLALKGGLTPLLSLGIGVTLAGIVETIIAIMRFINDSSWSNFNDILKGIAITITGIGIALVGLNATNPIGWIVIATGVLVAYTAEMSNMIRKLIEGKAEILSSKEAQDQLNKARRNGINAEEDYANAIDNSEEAQKRLKDIEEQSQISGEALYNSVKDGTTTYKELDDVQKQVYKAYLDTLSAEEWVDTATQNLTEAKKKEKEMSWENQLALANESGEYDNFRDSVVRAYEDGSLEADEARDLIERSMSKIDKKTDDTFTKNIPNDIRDGLNPDHYRSNVWDLVNTINGILGYISIPQLSANIGGWLVQKARSLFGFAKGGIVVPLAKGGVINRPGRGVPLASGGAIGGERGAEGVIPLTDSQQMELLGEAIGRYITVNANIVTTMNGRVISRELKKAQNEDDFAFNR